MGMYDELSFKNPHPKLVCSNNHPIIAFQTKDFECLLDVYLVDDNKLYRSQQFRDYGVEPDLEAGVHPPADFEATTITVMANIYSDCKNCPPTTTLNKIPNFTDFHQNHYPWCEFEIFFRDGILQLVEPISIETPDEVRKKLEKVANTSNYYIVS